MALATPAEWVTHTASATQNPLTSADCPSSGMLSVVKEKRPLMPSSILASRVGGSRDRVSVHASAKSPGVNGVTDGITSASRTEAIASGRTGIGRWP